MSAEYDDPPEAVKMEVQRIADVNVAWLANTLFATGLRGDESKETASAVSPVSLARSSRQEAVSMLRYLLR